MDKNLLEMYALIEEGLENFHIPQEEFAKDFKLFVDINELDEKQHLRNLTLFFLKWTLQDIEDKHFVLEMQKDLMENVIEYSKLDKEKLNERSKKLR